MTGAALAMGAKIVCASCNDTGTVVCSNCKSERPSPWHSLKELSIEPVRVVLIRNTQRGSISTHHTAKLGLLSHLQRDGFDEYCEVPS